MAGSPIRTIFGTGSGSYNSLPYYGFYSVTRDAEDKLHFALALAGSITESTFGHQINIADEWCALRKSDGIYTYVTSDVYEDDATKHCFFYFGGPRFDFDYTVGSTTGSAFSRTGLTVGNYGTISFPFAVTNVEGATFYRVSGVYKNASGQICGVAMEEVEAANLKAGAGYIFKATATSLTATYSSVAAHEQEPNSVGNPGTEKVSVSATAGENFYVLSGGKFVHLAGTASANIGAQKAYFDLSGATVLNPADQAPNRVILGVNGVDSTTSLDEAAMDATATKYFRDGQLLISKNGANYNALGQLVK